MIRPPLQFGNKENDTVTIINPDHIVYLTITNTSAFIYMQGGWSLTITDLTEENRAVLLNSLNRFENPQPNIKITKGPLT